MAVSISKVFEVFNTVTGATVTHVLYLPKAKAIVERDPQPLDYESALQGFYLVCSKGGKDYVRSDCYPTRGEADKAADWLNMSDDFASYSVIFNP